MAVIGGCILLGACSTIIEGRSRQIMLNTNPARRRLRAISPEHPHRDGAEHVRHRADREDQARHLGRVGEADNKYDSPVNMTLVPNMPGQPEGPATLPASYSAVPVPARPADPPTPAPTTTR